MVNKVVKSIFKYGLAGLVGAGIFLGGDYLAHLNDYKSKERVVNEEVLVTESLSEDVIEVVPECVVEKKDVLEAEEVLGARDPTEGIEIPEGSSYDMNIDPFENESKNQIIPDNVTIEEMVSEEWDKEVNEKKKTFFRSEIIPTLNEFQALKGQGEFLEDVFPELKKNRVESYHRKVALIRENPEAALEGFSGMGRIRYRDFYGKPAKIKDSENLDKLCPDVDWMEVIKRDYRCYKAPEESIDSTEGNKLIVFMQESFYKQIGAPKNIFNGFGKGWQPLYAHMKVGDSDIPFVIAYVNPPSDSYGYELQKEDGKLHIYNPREINFTEVKAIASLFPEKLRDDYIERLENEVEWGSGPPILKGRILWGIGKSISKLDGIVIEKLGDSVDNSN
ncbi:hypothetical protein HOD75_00965 [archaeon]|jgi:hypothetical protein|nr:hypothetical protein [archaeon]MBT4241448.1 hypothetical protein [archaeon]MBT4417681.1 hypothetical protein [archaeon]